MCRPVCVVCAVCVLCARVLCAMCSVCQVCVCVLCVCAWQNNQHPVENNGMNFQTNCYHQTKKGISLGGWPGLLACRLAAASAPTPTSHPHVCILQNKQ